MDEESLRPDESHAGQSGRLPDGLLYVGIASSAGGLEALGPLVANLSPDAHMAYVIVQHLAPQHRSMLANLLARETPLKVEEIADRTVIAAGAIYITPPNHDVVLKAGALRLLPPSHPVGPKPSADRFFESLAAEAGERAVAVVLSGTGSDGAAGIRAIKNAGGVVLAQDPRSARYDGMPRSAIDTGVIDAVLPPAELGQKLTEYAAMPNRARVFPQPVAAPAQIKDILSAVQEITQVDFSGYKASTLRRRLARRMGATGVSEPDAYLALLRRDPAEADRFVQDALISVTSFFRDRESFDKVPGLFEQILKRKADGDSVRLWVPGCATGEEAYSLAILLHEAIRRQDRRLNVQIFATDLDLPALEQARLGAYPEAAADHIPAEQRGRYFIRQGQSLSVTKELRDSVLFAKHDVTRDTPFVRIDLISCRNLLIYMDPDLQHDVLSSFHFALVKDGFLILGKSESIGPCSGLFAPVFPEQKIFRRNPAPQGHVIRPFPLRRVSLQRPRRASPPELAIQRALIEQLQPKALLLDSRGDIRETEGNLDGYISIPPGKTQLNATKLLAPELRGCLWSLLIQARRDKSVATSVPRQTLKGLVRIAVHPAGEDESGEALFLAIIEELSESPGTSAVPTDERVPDLEQELVATREHLQSVIEELEASNEELQALNEELQASNEELQATSEEMETSNEELQATNEELTTVNEELRTRTAELQALNDDLENIQHSIGYALVILDRKLRIKRYSPEIVRYFGIAASDIGEPLTGVAIHVDIPDLFAKLSDAQRSGTPHALDVETDQASLAVRIRPFLTASGDIEGAVIVILDETRYRRAQRRLAASEERFALAVRGSLEGIWDQQDLSSDRGFWSPRMLELLGLPPDEPRTSLAALEERVHPDDRKAFRNAMQQHFSLRQPFDIECRLRIGPAPVANGHDTPTQESTGQRSYGWFRLRGQAIWNNYGQPLRMAGSLADIDARKEAEIRIHSLNEQLLRAEDLAGIGYWRLDLANESMTWSDEVYRIHGAASGFTPTMSGFLRFLHADDRALLRRRVEDCRRTGASFRVELRVIRAGGEERIIEIVGESERDLEGNITAIFGVMHDVTETKRLEKDLRGQAADLGRIVSERTAELEQRLQERDLLMRELQHRVKNNLQMIAALIGFKRKAHPEADRVLDDIAQRLQAIALVYDVMTQRQDTDRTDLVIVLRQICDAVDASTPAGISVVFVPETPRCLLPAQQSVNLALVVHELVLNAIKYAFPEERGQIQIHLGRLGGEWRLMISDDGVGIGQSKQADNDGFGLKMVRWIVHGMDGRLERIRQSVGTRFDVAFPVLGVEEDHAGSRASSGPVDPETGTTVRDTPRP